jgi:hypothetical protein
MAVFKNAAELQGAIYPPNALKFDSKPDFLRG